MLLNRVKRHIQWRAFVSYCEFLRKIKCLKPVKIAWKTLDKDLPIFICTTREADVPMVYYNLKSLMENAKARPPIWLFADSDPAYYKLQNWLSDRPPDIKIYKWQDLFIKLKPIEKSFIQSWLSSGCNAGYAKKFSVILAMNSDNDILSCDADVLWFGDFFSVFQRLKATDNTVYLGKDYVSAYDTKVIESLDEPKISKGEPINGGFVYYPQGVFLRILTPDILTKLTPLVGLTKTPHVDQAIMSYIFWRSGGRFFASDVLATTIVDVCRIKKQTQTLLRHYAGAQYMFWRDA